MFAYADRSGAPSFWYTIEAYILTYNGTAACGSSSVSLTPWQEDVKLTLYRKQFSSELIDACLNNRRNSPYNHQLSSFFRSKPEIVQLQRKKWQLHFCLSVTWLNEPAIVLVHVIIETFRDFYAQPTHGSVFIGCLFEFITLLFPFRVPYFYGSTATIRQ